MKYKIKFFFIFFIASILFNQNCNSDLYLKAYYKQPDRFFLINNPKRFNFFNDELCDFKFLNITDLEKESFVSIKELKKLDVGTTNLKYNLFADSSENFMPYLLVGGSLSPYSVNSQEKAFNDNYHISNGPVKTELKWHVGFGLKFAINQYIDINLIFRNVNQNYSQYIDIKSNYEEMLQGEALLIISFKL